jgi:hypothetical protein
MDEHSRPASYDDLTALVQALNLTSAEYLLIGGYALFAHGYHHATTGIDLDGISARTIDLQRLSFAKQTLRDRDVADRIVLNRALSALRTESGKT